MSVRGVNGSMRAFQAQGVSSSLTGRSSGEHGQQVAHRPAKSAHFRGIGVRIPGSPPKFFDIRGQLPCSPASKARDSCPAHQDSPSGGIGRHTCLRNKRFGMGVRLPPRAPVAPYHNWQMGPAQNREVAGSNPAGATKLRPHSSTAERAPHKRQAEGSTPSGATKMAG